MAGDPPLSVASPPGLAARIRGGDAQAFEALFRAEYGRLCSFLQSQVREAAVAEELAQDVMLRLWQARERLHPDASLRAYLYRSARNAAINRNRRAVYERNWAVREAHAPVPAGPGADARVRTSELAAAAAAAIAALPDRCRLIFLMSRSQHLSHAEIAESLDLSRKTVEAQIGRALKLLRDRLAPYME